MKKLQVLIDNQWQYVFCRNQIRWDPITTKEKRKALPIHFDQVETCLSYFQRHFSEHKFRIAN